MKKFLKTAVALLLVLVTCMVILASCGKKESESDLKSELSNTVKYSLMSYVAQQKAIYGKSYTFVDHTVTNVRTKTEGKEYEISGKLNVKDSSGTKYSASYTAEIEKKDGDYKVTSYDVGTFR